MIYKIVLFLILMSLLFGVAYQSDHEVSVPARKTLKPTETRYPQGTPVPKFKTVVGKTRKPTETHYPQGTPVPDFTSP